MVRLRLGAGNRGLWDDGTVELIRPWLADGSSMGVGCERRKTKSGVLRRIRDATIVNTTSKIKSKAMDQGVSIRTLAGRNERMSSYTL